MKVGKIFEIETCNQKIMEMFTKILPHPDAYPETDIHVYVRDDEGGGIQWAVQFTQPIEEFARLVMHQEKIDEEKRDLILIIGDERVPNGLYLLYSQVEAKILQCKFHTKEEAMLYAAVANIGHFRPYYMTKSFARYPWFDGVPRLPDDYGFQPAQISSTVK